MHLQLHLGRLQYPVLLGPKSSLLVAMFLLRATSHRVFESVHALQVLARNLLDNTQTNSTPKHPYRAAD